MTPAPAAIATSARRYQSDAVDAVSDWHASPETRGAMLVMATGCHPAGTPILMWDGTTKAVEDVVVGDLLMGPDSQPRRVLRLARGKDEIWEVVPTKGDPWRVNPDHILTLYRTPINPDGPPCHRSALVDVSAREWVTWSKTKKHRHKLIRTGVDFQRNGEALPVPPWLLGALLGDGCLVKRGLAVNITSMDEELVEAVEAEAVSKGWATSRYQHANRCPGVIIKGARPSLTSLGLNKAVSRDKFVPHQYLTASRGARLDVLAGLLDTDGHLTYNTYDYVSKSRRLADDVAFLARSLGLAAYVRESEKVCQTGAGGTYHRVSISGDTDTIPCRLSRKRATPRRQKKNHLVTGFTIRECGYEAPYYGFALDGDQRYLLGDFTVTHNTGKTYTGHLYATRFLERGERVLWLAHREELIDQPLNTLKRWWPHLKGGIVQADRNEPDAPIVYASKDTLRVEKRLAEYLSHGAPSLIVVDESHHSASPTYKKLLDKLRATGAKVLGLTATPDRDDAKRLGDDWEIVYSYSILDALKDKALIPPYAVVDMVPNLDLSAVGGRKDYIDHELGRELLKAHIVEHTVAALAKTHLAARLPFRDHHAHLTAQGQGVLVFTATVEQATLTATALCEAGWKARVVSGETPKAERKRLLKAFEAGLIDVLCNAVVLTEGTDLPRASVVVLARPTKSWSLFVQMLGRALRPYEGQDKALIIDLAGATEVHSIIAAPVLVDGTDCPEHPTGAHAYMPIEGTGEGRCMHCGRLIKCYARLGGHLFKDGRCKKCDATQCPEAEDHLHHWAAWEGNKRRCSLCGMEIPDPTAALAGRRKPSREPVAFVELNLPGTVFAANLGPVGVLFNVGVGAEFQPLWVHAGKVRALSTGPVSPEMSRLLLDDVARRAQKVNGQYGGAVSERKFQAIIQEALVLARQHKVWKMGTTEK